MCDIMIDLETLGTKPGSVFFALGAVPFDRYSGEVHQDHGFYRLISIADAIRWGLTRDADTITWWSRQSPEAQAEFWKAMGGGEDLSDVIEAFVAWLDDRALKAGTKRDKLRVWGNGATFDNALVFAGCRERQLPLPWNGFNDRCFRTLKSDNPGLEPVREGVHHHALYDAIHQAKWACAIYRHQNERRSHLLAELEKLRFAAENTPMSARARAALRPACEDADAALTYYSDAS